MIAKQTDAALVRRINHGGDENAFRELYHRHTPRLYQLLRRLAAGNREDAEDWTQETWLRAVRGLRTWRADGSLASWLRGIAVHVAHETYRRPDRRAGRFADTDPDELPALRWNDGDRLDLERAIARLPQGYRSVLILHDLEGYTHFDIAAAMSIAVGTSKSQLFEARRAVRVMLQETPDHGETAS
jgi:RNA polymerase sigma-70 factor (ECF subfamily)